MRRIVVALTFCAFFCSLPAHAQRGFPPQGSENATGRRVALVIGNQAYPQAALKNPVNDANDLGALLRDLGFDTDIQTNTGLQAMDAAIDRFIAKLRPGDVALFYFSGHGIALDGQNYLLPVSFAAQYSADVKYQAYSANRVSDLMQGQGVRLSILILDACRDNPYRSLRGSAGGLTGMSAAGAYIAFAAAEGRTADDNASGHNGLFTAQLLDVLREQGLKIDDVFDRVRERVYEASNKRQLPFSYSGVVGDFYFHPAPSAATTPVASRPVEATVTMPSGTLEVSSDQGGIVYVDGRKYEELKPYAVLSLKNIDAGSHQVRVEKSNYQPQQRDVTVVPGKVEKAEFRLDAVPAAAAAAAPAAASLPAAAPPPRQPTAEEARCFFGGDCAEATPESSSTNATKLDNRVGPPSKTTSESPLAALLAQRGIHEGTGPRNHSISGTVTDLSHATIPGATVTAVDKKNQTSFTTQTDEKGRFTVRCPDDADELIVYAPGFQTVDYSALEHRSRINPALSMGSASQVVVIAKIR